MRRLLFFLVSIILIAPISFSVSGSSAQAAGDCGSLRSQIFGTGSSDRESAQFQYNNLKSALAKSKASLAAAEQSLEAARKASAAYFLQHGQTHGLLEFKLHSASERAREDRANVQYYTQRLNSAAARLRRLSAEYKRLGCAGGGGGATTTEDWAGTYVDTSGHKLEISGSGATFTAESTWTASATQGGSNTMHCTANGSTAKCTGTGSYFDSDKTITTTTQTTLRKSGSTIREHDKVLTASCSPKKEGVSDCKDLGYTPAVHAGAEFTITLRKE